MKEKVAYLTFGHVDVTLPLIEHLHKRKIECQLYFCFSQNRKSESVINFNSINVPNGLLDNSWNHKLIDNELFVNFPLLNQAKFYIFHSLRIFSIYNFFLTIKLAYILRKYTIIHASGDSGFLVLLFLILKLFKKKLVFTVHDLNLHTGERKGRFDGVFRNFIYLFSNKVILQNPVDYEEAKSNIKFLRDKSVFLPFGVLYLYKYFNQLSEADFYVSDFLFFGRISKYKGLSTLFKAVEKIYNNCDSRFSLIIAGSGSDESLELFQQYSNVRIINRFISNNELAAYIRNTKVVLCPYTDATQSGVLMTTFAFMKPVIASKVGGFIDIVSSYHTGLLVEANNEDELQRQMIFSLDNINKFTACCENGIDELMNNSIYSWDSISNNLSILYKDLF